MKVMNDSLHHQPNEFYLVMSKVSLLVYRGSFVIYQDLLKVVESPYLDQLIDSKMNKFYYQNKSNRIRFTLRI